MMRVYRAVNESGNKLSIDMDTYYQMARWIHSASDEWQLIEVSKDWSTDTAPSYEINLFKFRKVKK